MNETKTQPAVGSMPLFGGIRVYESVHCQKREQFRFPRSKKKRIRNKWAKRERNYKYTPMAFRGPENSIYCHPSIAARLRASLPNEEVSHAAPPAASKTQAAQRGGVALD